MSETLRDLGSYLVGEVPLPFTYEYEDDNGETMSVISSATYQAEFRVRREGAAPVAHGCVIDPAGFVTYTPLQADFQQPGEYVGEFWAIRNDLGHIVASKIGWHWTVYQPASSPEAATPTPGQTSTCGLWATQDDLGAPCATGMFAPGLVQRMLQVASDILYELSGGQFSGLCTTTVHPMSSDCMPRGSLLWTRMRPDERVGGSLGKRITLGVYPLVSVSEVVIDGAVLDPDAYRIEDQRWLTRIDGGVWPWVDADWQQDPDAFRVVCGYGQAPPPAGVAAAAELACQLLLATDPNAEGCVLPQRVQAISRQGVSMAILDPMDFLREGRTGIYLVDLFLEAVNPTAARRRAQVLSPDIGPRVRRYPS